MATKAKLYYFNGRGRAEIIRFTLAVAGIEFTEEFLTEKEQFEQLKKEGKLLFLQVPLLEIDGLQLVQTGAIVRYLARKAGLYGQTNEETTKIDMMFEGSRDFIEKFLLIGFMNKDEVLKSAKVQTLPRYLPIFEEQLHRNGTGFLVGKSLSLADIGLLEPLLTAIEYMRSDLLKDYPSLQTFYSAMTSVENISAFLNGPQRKPPNDDAYITTVKRVIFS